MKRKPELLSKIFKRLLHVFYNVFDSFIDELDLDDFVEDLIPKQRFKRKPYKKEKRKKRRNKAARKVVEQINYQKEQTEQILGTIELTLLRKLSPTEITYSRYKNASEKVADAIMQNIELLNHKSTILEGLDYASIAYQLKKLQRNRSSDSSEIENLEQRKKSIEQLSKEIKNLFEKNNQGLHKLEELTIALAQLSISEGKEVNSFEDTIEDLDNLIDQVDLYDSSKLEKIKI